MTHAIIESLNAWGGRFAGFAAPMLIQSTILIGLLLALDWALRRRVRATVRYAVWMLVLVKLALPPSLGLPTAAAYWLPAEAEAYSIPAVATVATREETIADTAYGVASDVRLSTPLGTGFSELTWPAVCMMIWLVVVVAMGFWVIGRLRLVSGMVRHSSEAPERVRIELESCRVQLGIKRTIPVRCAALRSPAICGMWRPIILIPPGVAENLNRSEMRSVLLHELAHFKRGDLWVNTAQIFLQILYWYNPLLWLANGSIRRAREQAVDEMVLVELGGEASEYSATLLRVAKLGLGRPLAALGLIGIMEPGRGLTRRIRHIVDQPMPRTARIGTRGLGAVLLLALVALPMACRKPEASESAQANAGSANDELTLSMSKEGAITLGKEIVTLEHLQNKLAEVARQNPRAALVIEADQSTPWAKVSKVLAAAQAAPISVSRAVSKATPRSDWSGKQIGGLEVMRPRGMFSAAEVDALEAKLVEDQEDFSARRDLLGYYAVRDRGAKARHVLWIIEHHPEFSGDGRETALDPIREGAAYKQGKVLWLKNVGEHPTDTMILGNAAAYFTIFENAKAEEFLTKAQALEPERAVWSERLGQLYKLEANGNPGTNLAAKALAEFEKAQVQSARPGAGSPALADLAKMALEAGDLKKARAYAEELGPGPERNRDGNAGDGFFHANIVLGRIALHDGKTDEAKKYLLEAGRTKGSPVLGSFGPSMMLARELLERGETNAVLEYFQECGVFWRLSPAADKLAAWTAAVKDGKTPDFGANLVY